MCISTQWIDCGCTYSYEILIIKYNFQIKCADWIDFQVGSWITFFWKRKNEIKYIQ